jgi:aminodeoxyfutalosine deaminase
MMRYTARWIFPVAGPPIPGGSVSFSGTTITEVSASAGGKDLGDVAILPGFVNAHTHLDLSGARGRIPPTAPELFCDWLRAVIAFRRTRPAADLVQDCAAGVAEAVQFGTTLLGDIVGVPVAVPSPVPVVRFREVLGLAPERFAAAVAAAEAPLSLHAPYSVNAAGARALFARAGRIAVHVAESPGELELLAHRRGPFVDFLQLLGVYDSGNLANSVPDFLTGNIAQQLLIHANYLPADYPFGSHQGVVVCPRTHAAFGHPSHPFPHWLRRGVPVAFGTDSLASNPDLDPLAEAAAVREGYPDVSPAEIVRAITATPAGLLGFPDRGVLAPGFRADFVIVPVGREVDPYDALFAADRSQPRTVIVGGLRIA